MNIILAMIVYLLRFLVIGFATGTLFIKLKLFVKMSNKQVFLVGIASTPMFIGLIDYLLGLVFIGWGSWFYFLVPIVIATLIIILNLQTLISTHKEIWAYIHSNIVSLRKWILLDLIIALIAVALFSVFFKINEKDLRLNYIVPLIQSINIWNKILLLLLATIIAISLLFVFYQMKKDHLLKKHLCVIVLLIIAGFGIVFGMSFNGRPEADTDRAHYQLNARYFCEDKNSWEIDNYTDEKYGSSLRDDHGPLWTVFLGDAQILADMLDIEDPIRISNFAVFVVYFCFQIIFFLTAYYISGKVSAGIVSLLLFGLYRDEIRMIFGSREAFRFIGLLLLFLYTASILFEIIKNKAKWYHFLCLGIACYLSMNGHEGNAYIMLGMFIIIAIMLVCYKTSIKNIIYSGMSVFIGTVIGSLKTIQIYLETGRIASSTILPFHDTPVAQQVIELNNKGSDWGTIWSTYTIPIIGLLAVGIIGLFFLIIFGLINQDSKSLVCGLISLGMLLPMTGIFNWIGYDFSRSIAQQTRYRMYFMMILALFAAWLLTKTWRRKTLRYVSTGLIVLTVCLFCSSTYEKISLYNNINYVEPYIIREKNYKELADEAITVTNGDVFTANQVMAYYLHGSPKLLFHIYSEDIMQAKTEPEIEKAMERLNVGAIILPESGLEYHNYSLLPFWKYINNDSRFKKIPHTKSGYVMFVNKNNMKTPSI